MGTSLREVFEVKWPSGVEQIVAYGIANGFEIRPNNNRWLIKANVFIILDID